MIGKKQQVVDLTLSHVWLTAVDSLTPYLSGVYYVLALPRSVLEHEPNPHLVEIKRLSELAWTCAPPKRKLYTKARHTAFLIKTRKLN